MKQKTKQFERQFIRTRNAIERKGIAMIKRALTVQYNSFLEKTKSTNFRQWPQLVETISQEPIEKFFKSFYPMSARLALMTRKNMLNQKDEQEDTILESIFQAKLSRLVRESNLKIESITNTTQDKLRQIINNIISEGDTEGWGIDKITSKLYKEVGKNLRGNGFARAKAIAQTEMISASNQASEYAAQSTGYAYKKFWSTSGLQDIRDTHLQAEQYSDEKNGLNPNETFPNGLLYPGDPNGPAEEVINCRCTIMHEIVI